MKAFTGSCALHASVIDGFPPYAWPTCADWMAAYGVNSKAIALTDGALEIGEPVYTEVSGKGAYLIYPAIFSDQEKGRPVVYKGTWTMTLRKSRAGWLVTGSSSNWGGNYTVGSGS